MRGVKDDQGKKRRTSFLKERSKKLLQNAAGLPGRWAGLVLPLSGLLQIVLFSACLVRSAILRPFGDMISWIDAYLQARDSGQWLAYLWMPHNEHHLLLIRALTALDVGWLHASGLPFVVAATASLMLIAWLVLTAVRGDAAFAPPRRALAWLGPMVLLNNAAVADCAISINAVYPMALVFIVATVFLFDAQAEHTRHTSTRRALAFLTATLAGLCNGVGMVAWPVLLWSAWRGKARPGWLLTIALLGLAYGAIYLQGLPTAGHARLSEMFVFPHLAKMANYLLAYLGLPLSRAPGLQLPGRLFGALLLAACLLVVMRDAIAPRQPGRLHRLGIGLILAGLAAASLAVAGRVDLTENVAVPLRYVVMLAPLHIGLLMVALPWLANRAVTAQQQARLLAGACACAAFLLIFQVLAGRTVIAASDAILATLDRYDAGLREPGMTHVLFPDLAVADRVLKEVRK
jgi:hypothetical protein